MPASISCCFTQPRTALHRQVEVLGHLGDRAVTGQAPLDHVGFELRGELATGRGLFLSIVSILGHPFGPLGGSWWTSVETGRFTSLGYLGPVEHERRLSCNPSATQAA